MDKIKFCCYLLLISHLFIFSLGCSDNQSSLLKHYIASHNAHNIEKSLSFFSEDIEFELKGTWIKKGKPSIRELEEWDSELNSKLDFEVSKISGDTLFCTGTEQNDWFKAVGIEEISYDSIIFVFENSKIKKITAIPNKEVNKKIGQAMGSIVQYTKETQNNILSELIPNGEFVYSRESAQKWLELFKEMNSAEQPRNDG